MKGGVSSEGRSVEMSDVGRDWLPLHRAYFYFFPEFGGTDRVDNMLRLLNLLVANDPATAVTYDAPESIQIATDGVLFTIDLSSGEFQIGPLGAEDVIEQVTKEMEDPVGRPDQFIAHLAEAEPRPEYEKGIANVRSVSDRLWRSLTRRFDEAVRDGTAQIFGRWRELDAPFQRVHYDQWRQLAVDTFYDENQESDVVSFQSRLINGNSIVHSIYVKPNVSQVRSKSSAHELECTKWLVDLMRASPDKPRARQSLLVDARRLFPKVSPTGFKDRIWPDAIEQAPAHVWARPGNRPGHRAIKSKDNQSTTLKFPKKK